MLSPFQLKSNRESAGGVSDIAQSARVSELNEDCDGYAPVYGVLCVAPRTHKVGPRRPSNSGTGILTATIIEIASYRISLNPESASLTHSRKKQTGK
jgi:hypothetical protein